MIIEILLGKVKKNDPKATGENIEAPHQLEKFMDKEERFDIIENNNDKIKKYILSKI